MALDKLTELLTTLAPLLAVLVSTGLVAKLAPFAQKARGWLMPLVPFINALIAFLAVFGPAPAHAGIFGDVVHQLSGPAKAVGSLAVSAFASAVYEVFLRHPIDKWVLRRR